MNAQIGYGHNYDHLGGEMARFLRNYKPRVNYEHWDELQHVVRDSVAATMPTSRNSAQQMLRGTYAFYVWIRDVAALEAEPSAFTARNIHRFVESTISDEVKARDTLMFLARIVEALTGTRAPHLPTVRRDPRRYSAAEIAALSSAAATRTTERLRLNAKRVIALGRGAGVQLTEMEQLRVADVHRTHVSLPDRITPILPEWRDDLAIVGHESPDDYFLLPYAPRRRPGVVLTQFLGELNPRPDGKRLRAGYISELLERDLPASTILAVTGLRFAGLDRYRDFTRVPDEDELLAQFDRMAAKR